MVKNSIYKVIILGSLWGITEATAGYLLHLLPIRLGWLFWFPIAFFFINKSYQLTKNYSCVMLTALLTSLIKLINIFFTIRIDVVVNPAVSIILEAFAVVMAVHYFKSGEFNPYKILMTNFLWRTLYLSYVLLLPENLIEISPAADTISFVRFFFLENIANTALIFICLFIFQGGKVQEKFHHTVGKILNSNRFLKPALSALILIAAVFVKIITI